jgi:hypothetical protein
MRSPPQCRKRAEQSEGGGAGLSLDAEQGRAGRPELVRCRGDHGWVLTDAQRGRASERLLAEELAKGQHHWLADGAEGFQGSPGGRVRCAREVEGEDRRGEFVLEQPDSCPSLTPPFGARCGRKPGQGADGSEGESGQNLGS